MDDDQCFRNCANCGAHGSTSKIEFLYLYSRTLKFVEPLLVFAVEPSCFAIR